MKTLIIAPQIAKRHGLQISRIDFSEPQGGTGAHDRKAATVKSHMAQYLNSGHDLLLSEVSRQINMIVKTRLQEKTFRVYLVTRFCLKSAFSIHIQSYMTPTTSVSYC